MPTTFRPYHPDQDVLLPSNVRGWLPEGHLAHHVSDLLDGLDLEAFCAPCEGDGRRKSPYDPRMLLKVLIYGCATGVFSSRRLARKLEEDMAFRVPGAGNFPSHRTIGAFRRRHPGDFKRLFVEVVRIAGEIDALAERTRETDAAEDERFGESFRGDGLPEELRRRAGAIRATQVAGRGAHWLDQGDARLPPVRPARAGAGPGRVGPGLSGVERQTDAGASGGMKTPMLPRNQAARRPVEALPEVFASPRAAQLTGSAVAHAGPSSGGSMRPTANHSRRKAGNVAQGPQRPDLRHRTVEKLACGDHELGNSPQSFRPRARR